VRVILLGSTGLEGTLRLDPGVELVRAKQALDAVGELAQPTEASRTLVLVGEDVERELELTSPLGGLSDLVQSLRLVDGAVRVLRVGVGGRSDIYDGEIDPHASAEALRDALRVAAPRLVREPDDEAAEEALAAEAEREVAPVIGAVLGDAPVRSAPERARHEAPASRPPLRAMDSGVHGREMDVAGAHGPVVAHDADDLAMIALLMRGADVATEAIRVLRTRLGDPEARFAPGAPSPTDDPRTVYVSWRGRAIGRLLTRVTTRSAQDAADWLGAWLALGQQQQELRRAAFTDPLTGAWNRRYADRFLDAAIRAARDARRQLTVFVFDIDDFKRFNDEHGHAAGDEILAEVVRLMQSVVRPTDRVCRVGGDEFVVIFNEPDGPREATSRHPESVRSLTRRFTEQVARKRFEKLGHAAPGRLSISGGIATFPWDGMTPGELMFAADQRSLESKRQGKDAITFGPGFDGHGG
jgi:diguanylate cyclase (GGDEF)-like protein